MARAAKGRLRIDHPRLAIEGSEPRAKGRFGGERRERARQVQVALCKGVTQTGDEFPAKDLAQHLHGEKEGRTRVDPPRPVWGQSAGGHDAVDVRMMLEALPPRVEDHETADRRAQAFRLAATCRGVAVAARNRRSYTTRLFASARRASGSGIVKTRCT